MGFLKDLTGNITAGLLTLGGCAVVGAVVAILLRIASRLEAPTGVPAAAAR